MPKQWIETLGHWLAGVMVFFGFFLCSGYETHLLLAKAYAHVWEGPSRYRPNVGVRTSTSI